LSAKLVKGGTTQRLEFKFNLDVSRSLSLVDFDVFTSKGYRVAKYTYTLSYNKSTNTAVLTFKTPLKAGTWQAVIWPGGVADAQWKDRLDGNGDGKSGDAFKFNFSV
jgi:hypothetical protein